MSRAFEIIGAHPMFGVGPARYGPELIRMGVTEADVAIVHSIPVLIAAEYGVPVGIMFSAWLLALGWYAMRTSLPALAILAAIVPYLVFDLPHVVYVYGVVEFGLCIAALDFLRRVKLGAQADEAEVPTTA